MIRVQRGQWVATYKGGRLADISHVEYPGEAQACMEALPHDMPDRPDYHRLSSEEKDARWHDAVTADLLQQALDEWIAEDGSDYRDQLQYR